MAKTPISLSQLIQIKGGNIEELCLYAKSKGLNIPNDPNYLLSPSELNALDPVLAFQMKFPKTVTSSKNKGDDQETIVSKQDDNNNDAIKNSPKNKTPKRIIGIVKFFDSFKEFGFIISNNKGISGKPEDEGRLFDIYINSSEWKSSSSPSDNEWVILTPKKDKRGKYSAINAERLAYNRESLLLAMKYRGRYAKISGLDSKGDRHNENILCNIINKISYRRNINYRSISYDNSKFPEIIDAFCEYLSQVPIDRQEQTIRQFLEDGDLNNLLFKIFTEGNYPTEDPLRISSFKLFRKLLLESILESGKLSDLSKLPSSFDFLPFIDKITPTLISEAKSNSEVVKNWLITHPIIEKLNLDDSDVNTIPLRLVLGSFTGDDSWINNLNAEWTSIKDFIKNTPDKAYPFFINYFKKKDIDYIEKHDVSGLFDNKIVRFWCDKLMQEKEVPVTYLRFLMEHDISGNLNLWGKYVNADYDITPSLQKLGKELSNEIKENAESVRAFLDICIAKNIDLQNIFAQDEDLGDEMAIELFVRTNDYEYLNKMSDFEASSKWVSSQPATFVASFIKDYGSLIQEEDEIESDTYIQSLGDEAVTKALKSMPEDEQFQTLRYFPKEYATSIVTSQFADSNLFNLYIGEQWDNLKSKLPYMVFDIESDGDDIKEFAFRSSNYTHYSEDPDQLPILINEINNKKIIVGHRIKQWDLKILESYGKIAPEFIWDTLEIEILLNPCRYAYSLHTKHNAKDDTELTDRLFWNQLFRLAMNEELCKQLSDFLPTNITSILNKLREPNFSQFFAKSGGSEDTFYQSLRDIDTKLVNELDAIDAECANEQTIIIAPQRLWNRLAEHIHLSFIREESSIDYLIISEAKLKEMPLSNSFLQAVLLRFCQKSKTPIVSNLAPYLRIQYFTNDVLRDYVTDIVVNTQCADLRFIESDYSNFECSRLYFVGCELENRLNMFSLSSTLQPSDFWSYNSSIPMRLGGSAYTSISLEERKSELFAEVPSDAANVWIERTIDGKYHINYNFNIRKKLEKLIGKLDRDVIVKNIPWTSEESDNSSVSLVRSGKPKHFDFIQKRVNSTTRYRSMYWMYQFALLNCIHIFEKSLPIIYILEDDLELKKIEAYAKSFGYYVPEEGTLISKLEKIAQRSNGLLIVPKSKFFEITDKRLYTAYCFVWDQMAVEKHMMMWNNTNESIGNNTLNDNIYEPGSEVESGERKDTYQSALLSLWPIYQYYSRFILANNSSSKMYILDSFLEEYHTLSYVWNTSGFASGQLWNNEEEFNESLIKARYIFGEISSNYSPIDNDTITKAMDVILATMVPERDGKRAWSDIQAEVLPEILSKKENYLISIPTGGGKSVLFQGPALYNSSYSNHLSLVVTPLKALMQDQVSELANMGFITNVDYLNSDRTYQEIRSIYRKINSGEIALLYITPERFRSRAFINALMTRMTNDNGLEYMIFDEAHCISQWGMDFRPEYLNVIKECKKLSETFVNGMCISMFSATVTDMIYNQINEKISVKRLGQDNDRKIYNPIRSHIGTSFQLVSHDMESRLKAIVSYIQDQKINFEKSRMLIFCKSRSQCEELATTLPNLLVKIGVLSENEAPERVGYFHAGLDADDRDDAYSRFKSEEDPIYILCATKAFGMGMDIPNIHYIIHICPPNVLEDYLQEVGRAGRKKELYQLAGFSEENPIPTVCLYSNEDIKKSREQLLQSMLSWKNLEEIREEILSYISKIQTIETTKKLPVVVPNTLWASSMNDFEYTDFKLGEYWLEQMNRINMGYLSSSHITITIKEKDSSVCPLLSSKEGLTTKRIHNKLVSLANEKGLNTIQVSIQQLSSDLSIHSSRVMNGLITCVKNGLISIDQEVRCRIANTRRDEVPYLLKNKQKNLAFHIIIDSTEKILQDNILNKEKTYFDKEIRSFIDMSSTDNILKKVIRKDEKGNENTSYYMPWYKEDEKDRNMGLSIAKNYKKDLMGKRIRQIFITLFDIIPDVKCKSYIDRDTKSVKQSILIEKNTWKTFLPEFKDDCLKVLQYIYDLQSDNKNYLNWSNAINELNLEKKGFNYFDNILRYLSGMAYIAIDNLLPMGIEICTTDYSERPILEELTPDSNDYSVKAAFDEAMQIRSLRLCVMDALTTKVKTKQDFQQLISAYFSKTDANGFTELLGKYYADNDPIWDTIRETAIKNEEEKMKDNPEQWAIYNENPNVNINVEAGPGSGKTHVLTMKCAKLIYRQHVRPNQILVLAYNRAVVVELKSRLTRLFTSLGLSRSASQLNVFTFHGLAKKVCGENALEGIPFSEWEKELLALLQYEPMEFTKIFSDLRYIFIDEFQDITQTRLDAMFELDKIYNKPAFFTIGDRDQSIYGFEKEESMDPEFYYSQLYSTLKPKQMTMFTNYRSYPQILKEAAKFLPPTSKVPVPCKKNVEEEPKYQYTFINNNQEWDKDFVESIKKLQELQLKDVAIFFRTNNEVYHGYSLIKNMNIPNVRIRIQGASECELFRKREIYTVIKLIENKDNKYLELDNDGTKIYVESKIRNWMNSYTNWDEFYFDFAYVLVLDYLSFAKTEDFRHTYTEMAESIKQTLSEDNPQLYKLYEKYQDQRILKEQKMDVILTTMHKVKGLEFDAVIITPSVASLPFDPTEEVDIYTPLTKYDKECIEEERRLLYVATTRARKFLFSYLGEREMAVLKMLKYTGKDDTLGIREKKPGLDNYNIGFNAGFNYNNNRDIVKNVKINAPVTIQRYDRKNKYGNSFSVYNIVFNGKDVGQLSQASSIRITMEALGLKSLSGFFVSDVFYWTYQDSLLADQRMLKDKGFNPGYAEKWCTEAIQKGYIFIVSISGYGK